MVTVRVARLCEQLWQEAGGPEPFPRDLQPLFAWALPLAVVTFPALWADEVARWLRERGLESPTGPRRRLRACVVAHRGRGFVLLDGRDSAEERRFSLAHEAGHFLLDYQVERERLLVALGPGIRPVLDGERPPSQNERLQAILAARPLSPRVHLMERRPDGSACGVATGAECAADELALELLAPEAAVLALLPSAAPGGSYAERERAAEELLQTHFGLPDPIAGRHARRLLRLQTGGPGTREWLRLTERQ